MHVAYFDREYKSWRTTFDGGFDLLVHRDVGCFFLNQGAMLDKFDY